ncbi:MAG: CRISPR-associated helicase Cas3' [Candidatus Omnitrophica bacterium]|nr:CRISPR-associated helicase Cas3' [Candidatus Omnitrophota bacterium]
MKNKYLAHIHDQDFQRSQSLIDHLQNVAQKCAVFSQSTFHQDNNFQDLSFFCGLLHDAGKYREAFQDYLAGRRERNHDTHHAIFGAAIAWRFLQSPLAALCIQGHHSGLHNGELIKNDIDKIDEDIQKIFDCLLADYCSDKIPIFPLCSNDSLTVEFQTRMLFSCLIDADWLDTAEFFGADLCSPTILAPDILLDRLQSHVTELSTNPDSNIQQIRRSIFSSCLEAGSKSQGFFSLTVPTGGGKTLSMMAFALNHAKVHNLRRVIVVIPYLSIIEQNAKIYRDVFGDEFVIEHHSSVKLDEVGGTEEEQKKREWERKLSIENWDAPIIVTTSVQLIESLFSNKPGPCRKLHNISNSVILFDESQLIPFHLLEPCLDVFHELVSSYGCSILFSSATQPSFTCKNIASLLKNYEIHEIISNSSSLYQNLKRVHFNFDLLDDSLSWNKLTQKITQHPQKQVLTVTNIRRHAFDLYENVKTHLPSEEHDSLFHLSSAMCAEHRSDILGSKESRDDRTIHGRLNLHLPCYLASTQLVEASVDINFPVVYRALGPLDSIVQSAGRCNREGKLDAGEVIVFNPDVSPTLPQGLYSTATNLTSVILQRITPDQLACDPGIFESYFNQLYPLTNTGDEIQRARKKLQYQVVVKQAKVIKENSVSIIAPYGKAIERIRNIKKENHFTQSDLRFFQRYMVTVYQQDYFRLSNLQGIDNLLPWIEIPVLREGFYHQTFGVIIDKIPVEDCIV